MSTASIAFSIRITENTSLLLQVGFLGSQLYKWKKEQGSDSPYVFPSPRTADKPIRSVKHAWRTTLKNAGVSYFPIYNLRHVFCTRLSWVAADAVVQRAMRHSSPETKRHYQLGMVDQVREGIELANERAHHGKQELLRFYYGSAKAEEKEAEAS